MQQTAHNNATQKVAKYYKKMQPLSRTRSLLIKKYL